MSCFCASDARPRNPVIVIKGKFQKRLLSLNEKESGLFALSVRMMVLGVLMVCPKFVLVIQSPAHQIDNWLYFGLNIKIASYTFQLYT